MTEILSGSRVADTLTAGNELTYFSFPIDKIKTEADGNVTVWGKATDGSIDSDQQIVDEEFAAKAIREWMDTGPNVRVQHQAQRDPAGVGLSFERDGDAHWVKSRIIEPVAKQLVLGGALRAYSVGIARPTIQRDASARGGRITDGQIVEISLVDRPANKNCGIQLVKSADGAVVTKVFGSDDVLTRMNGQQFENGDVTVTLPHDVQVGFSPADLAKIVSRRSSGFVTKSAPDGTQLLLKAEMDVLEEIGKAEDAVLGKASRHFSAESRRNIASSGNALPDGSYPIPDADALRRAAILARSKHGNWKAARRLIARRARELGVANPMKETAAAKADAEATALKAAEEAAEKNGGPHPGAEVRAHLEDAHDAVGHAMTDQEESEEKAGAAMNPAQAPPASMKKKKSLCAGCGAMQNRKHSFCAECGKAMAGAPEIAKNHDFVCLGCGHELDKGEQHCPECGRENPGYNPMADMKIPANKSDGSRVADDVTTVTDQDGETVVTKAKKPPKKGGKPFGGNQAAPFGKKPDGDADDADAKKAGDAPLTAAKGKKLGGKTSNAIPVSTDTPVSPRKRKRARDIPTSQTPDHSAPGHDAAPVPGHRAAAEGQVFDRMSGKFDADPDGTTMMRLKTLGVDTRSGYAHDLCCPAYTWDDVAKAYPSGLTEFSADEWQQKALDAVASAPLAQAQAASQLGQFAFAIKSADQRDLIDVKGDMHKAFKDAQPGPGSAPVPGEVCASHFSRPRITAGHASYGAHYGSPNSSPVPHGSLAASQFGRGNISPGPNESPVSKSGAAYPAETGVVMNLDYSSIAKEQVAQAMIAMHDHLDRVFPGVCPMNGGMPLTAGQHHLQMKGADEPDTTKKVSSDGLTKKQRAKRDAKLTRRVMKGKIPLDQARIAMGKKPKKSPAPLEPHKAAEPEIVKTTMLPVKGGLTRKDLRAALARSDKSHRREIAKLTSIVNVLADQPDPATQPFKGSAVHPIRKAASPAGVQSVADIAARTQSMILGELENTARNSTDPVQREAAWQQVLKMKGLISSS